MKKINFKKIFMFICIFLVLFNESLSVMLHSTILTYVDELFVVILFFYSIIQLLRKKKTYKIQLLIMIFIVLFSIIGIYSCHTNSNFNFSHVIISNFTTIKFWLLIFSLINIDISKDTKKMLYDCLELITKIVILFALINIFLPTIFYDISPFKISHRFGMVSVISLFEQPGKYGWFMLFMAIYYYCKYNDTKEKKNRTWAIICAVLSLFSMRTKVIIGMAIVVVSSLLLDKKINVKLVLGIFLVVLIIFGVFRNTILRTYDLYFNNNESEARVALNNKSLEIMKDYFPIGVGFGKYGSNFARVYYSEYYYKYGLSSIYGLRPEKSNYATDTFWPSIIGETGFLGFVSYIIMIIIVLFYLKRYKSFNATFAFLVFVQSICESFGEPSFISSPQFFILAIVVGFAINEMVSKNQKVGIK